MGKRSDALKSIESLIGPYRVTSGKGFRLKDHDPDDTGGRGHDAKERSRELLADGVSWLAEQQDKLYAQDRHALLLIFQAMDAAGKDGTIRHVMSGINPQGCQVYSFKQPSAEELDHDYMWRYHRCLPERGRIGIFNRSYYEEVLVLRVHPELLPAQHLPSGDTKDDIWDQRIRDMAAFEHYLTRQGVTVLKFFLNVSRKEQKKRFLERLEQPEKHWKFSTADIRERAYWKDYMKAYEAAIAGTASKHAPWYVVPADNKWYTRVVVAAAIVEAMMRMDLQYPTITDAQKAELVKAREALLNEAD